MRVFFGGDKMVKPLLCVTGTLGFCVLLNLPISKIIYVILGSAVSAVTFEFMTLRYSVFLSALCASLLAGIFSEISARISKTPSTVILLPCTIPLLPGSYLYYAMNYFVEEKYELFTKYLLETVYTCFGIALGMIITVTIILTLRKLKNR